MGLAYTPAALLALLLPKCPLCLAALLGVGFAIPRYSYALIVVVSVALGTLVVLRRFVSSRRRAGTRA